MVLGEFGPGVWVSERRIRAMARVERIEIPRHIDAVIEADGVSYAMSLSREIYDLMERTWGCDLEAAEQLSDVMRG
jgi:hypothetical protein